MKLFNLFKSKRCLKSQDKYVRIYEMTEKGKTFRVVITKRRANKMTFLKCSSNAVVWEQWFRAYGHPVDTYRCYTFTPETGITTIFVYKGKPASISGLDDGVFRCASRMEATCLTVVSRKEFSTM